MATYLTRTQAAGNPKKWNLSVWLKRSDLAGNNGFSNIIAAPSGDQGVWIDSAGNIDVYGTGSVRVKPKAELRDTSAWYHLVVSYNSTDSTSNDRIIIYLNGTRLDGFSTNNQPSLNEDSLFNVSGTVLHVGRRASSAEHYYQGYMSEMYFTDGYNYAASTFGSFNSDGVWVPNTSPSVTYGTNGFRLQFKGTGASADSSGFGADTSGNNNHLASNSLGTNPNTTDTPENVFATMNNLDVGQNHSQTTFSEGNLKVVSSGSTTGNGDQVTSTMGFANGKWYWEVKGLSNPDNMFWSVFNDVLGGERAYHDNYCYSMYGDGNGNHSQIYESQEGAQKGYGIDNSTCFSANDIIQFAFDCDNYRLYIGRNGSWVDDNAASGGTITSGSGFNESSPTGYYQISTSAAQAGIYRFAIVKAGGSVTYSAQVNFGNPSFTIASANADANGYGKFEYPVPSGYYALCTKNLATYG